MKSVKLVAFVFFVMTLVISCTKEEDPIATDPIEQKSGEDADDQSGNDPGKNDSGDDQGKDDTSGKDDSGNQGGNNGNDQGQNNGSGNNQGNDSGNSGKDDSGNQGGNNGNDQGQNNGSNNNQGNDSGNNSGQDNTPAKENPADNVPSIVNGTTVEVTISNKQLQIELYDAFTQKEAKQGGVAVELTGSNKVVYKATSDNNGVCKFNDLPDGKYTANIAKTGYYCPAVSGSVIKLYQKAKGYISGLTFYQRTNGIAFKAKLNDITIPSGVKEITLRFFVSKSQDVSKTNFGFEGNKTGVSTMLVEVPVSSINNNEIDYRDSRLCGWRDALQGTGAYMTCYITSTYKIDNDNFNKDSKNNENSGLGATKSANYFCR